MFLVSSQWTRLTVATLSIGVSVVGINITQAWQNQNPRPRTNTNPQPDAADSEVQVIRVPGEVTLLKCSVKLLDSVVLATDRAGLIAFVEPKEGDDVRKDQEIVFLKDDDLVALYHIAKAKAENDVNKRFAVASAAVAKAELEKMLESNRKVPGSIPATEVERARLHLAHTVLQGEQADHERAVAKLEVKKAAAELKASKVEAPFDGIVRKVLKQKGEAVMQGTPILELISTRTVKVEGYLPIEDFWNVKRGDVVEVQIEIPNRNLAIENEVFQGKVSFIDSTVSPVTHGARIWAEVQNPEEKLIEGVYAKMTIKHGRRIGSIAQPAAPVGSSGNSSNRTK